MKNIIKSLLVLLIIWPVYVQSQEPSPSQGGSSKQEQKQTAEKKKNPHYEQRGTKDAPLVSEVIQTNRTNERAEQQTDHEQEKSFHNKLMAYGTVALATITAFLALFTFLLWKSTGKLVVGTKKTAVQQLRAYIFAGLADGEKLFFDDSGRLTAPLIIKNYGQTPAYKLKSNVFIGRYKLPLAEVLDSPDYINSSLGCLAPKQIFRQYPKLPRKLSPVEVTDIKSRVCGIYVWGYLEYIDIFKIHRSAQFRMISTGADFDRGELAYCEEGNDETDYNKKCPTN